MDEDLLKFVTGPTHWDRLDQLEREIFNAKNPSDSDFVNWTYGLKLVFNMHSSLHVEKQITAIYRLLRSFPEFIEWELQQPDDNNDSNQEEQNQCSLGQQG